MIGLGELRSHQSLLNLLLILACDDKPTPQLGGATEGALCIGGVNSQELAKEPNKAIHF